MSYPGQDGPSHPAVSVAVATPMPESPPVRMLHSADEQTWNPDASAHPTGDHFAYSVGGTYLTAF